MTKIEMAPARPHNQGVPFFTCPTVWGASPDKPILYRIPLIGERPFQVTAENLPDGLSLDTETGILRGSLAEGSYILHLTASNRLGSALHTLTLRIAPDGARRTPLLGFTSWNAFGQDVSDELIRKVALKMDDLGLVDFGYQYVNIDSGWQGEYGGEPEAIQPNEKFPDMKALADTLHTQGLKIGIYSTPMQKAWGGYEYPGCTRGRLDPSYANTFFGVGSEHCEESNAAQWARWDIDYLKYDWAPCDTYNAQLMKDALLKQNRDIPMCVTVSAGRDSAEWWSTYCCSWRDNSDSFSEWSNVRTRFQSDDWAAYSNPGHYFDHDMLETGVTVWHENRLTEDEQVIAYSIRALFPSPIQISCSLDKLTDFDLALLENEEVIAVNQDALSAGAICVYEKKTRRPDRSVACDIKIYARPLENGDLALGIFNLGETDEIVHHPLEGRLARDLWAKKELAFSDDTLSIQSLSHTVRLFRLHI